MGPGHVAGAGLLQGRPPGACLAECRRRSLPLHRPGVWRAQDGGAHSAGSVAEPSSMVIAIAARLTIADSSAILRKPKTGTRAGTTMRLGAVLHGLPTRPTAPTTPSRPSGTVAASTCVTPRTRIPP